VSEKGALMITNSNQVCFAKVPSRGGRSQHGSFKKATYLTSSLFLKFPEVSFRANYNLLLQMVSFQIFFMITLLSKEYS